MRRMRWFLAVGVTALLSATLGAGVTAVAMKQGERGPEGVAGQRGDSGSTGLSGPSGRRGRPGPVGPSVGHEDIYLAMEADPGRVASALSEAGIPIDPNYLPRADDSGPDGSSGCDENYDPCVPIASDVDCASGTGDGPEYVDGPVYVIGDDIYGLDGDGDGEACTS